MFFLFLCLNRMSIGFRCAKGHVGAKSLVHTKLCEVCNLKQPSYGLPATKRVRWCAGCAAGQAIAVCLKSDVRRMCEGCDVKTPSFGEHMFHCCSIIFFLCCAENDAR